MAANEDYPVSEQTRRLWTLELELADTLLDVCEKYKLKVWACFGTLLGAARHQGFIPWDDDMDFVMMRADYDRLIDLITHKETLQLPLGYSFDTRDITVIKLCNNNTTMINPHRRWDKSNNHGVWIDVFCLDVAPDDLSLNRINFEARKRKIRMYSNRMVGYYAMINNLHYRVGHFCLRIFFLLNDGNRFRNRLENEFRKDASRFSGKKVWPFLIWSLAKAIKDVPRYDVSWFDKTILLPFEDRQLPCPEQWESLLSAQYGDWRTPVKGTSLHEGVDLNLDKAFHEVIEERLSKMPWWKRCFYTH